MPDKGVAAFPVLLLSVLAIICGALLIIGLITPIVSVIVLCGSAGIAASIIPPAQTELLRSAATLVYIGATALALAFLGPGAFSLDALMFGRREILIPGKPNLPKS